MQNRKYLVNVRERMLIQEALELTGRKDICIDDEPMPADALSITYVAIRPEIINRYISIYVLAEQNQYVDCSEFWQNVDKLKRHKKWQTYFALLGEDDYL